VVAPDPFDLVVKNIPDSNTNGANKIRQRLRQLAYNCGGKVLNVARYDAVVRFSTFELAARYQLLKFNFAPSGLFLKCTIWVFMHDNQISYT